MGGRVLVTGGTGFVGRSVVAALLARGREVTLALRRPDGTPSSPGIRRVVAGEIGRATDWEQALDEASCVVHLAAHVHVAPERAERDAARFDEVNRDGSVRLFEAASRRGVGSFVFCSSITVLGPESRPGLPLGDGSPLRPGGPYARSKAEAEEALRGLAAAAGRATPVLTILRPPLCCGPGVGGNLGQLARLAALPLPLPLGGIRNRRTLLAVNDLAAAIARVLEAPRSGTFVLGDRQALSTTDVVRHLRAGAGRPPMLLPLPAGLLRRAAAALGREGVARRLLGDLEVDAAGFRQAFGDADLAGAPAALEAAGAAARRR